MFEEYYNSQVMGDALVPLRVLHPFPKCGEPNRLSEEQKADMIAAGEPYLGYRWPVLPVTDYMAYRKMGSRVVFETPRRERRLVLEKLMDAELAEHKGRFLDDIANVMWAILEEMTWVVPAHNEVWQIKYNQWGKFVNPGHNVTNLLPDPDGPITVDLFSASTGGQLSVLYYLFEEQLDAICPTLRRQLEKRIDERILTPFTEYYYWWSGLEQKTNNWNPWIISNVLTAFAFVCKDPARRAQGISRCCFLLDRFLGVYHPDGGCDEGPSYWGEAGACLQDCLAILSDLTGGKFRCYFEQPLVQNIGRFIYRAHISGSYFMNYADAPFKLRTGPSLIYRYGKRIGDPQMQQFGASLYQLYSKLDGKKAAGSCCDNCYRHMEDVFGLAELQSAEAKFPLLESMYLDGIQVMAERQEGGSDAGLYLSAKGGTNNESHNHNDIGNFILSSDGEPALVDIGAGEYNSKTFSVHRYEIMQMQSTYHNVPEINGVAQRQGEKFVAADVSYEKKDGVTVFSENIAGAYPAEAGVSRWQRTFTFDRATKAVVLADEAVFNGEKNTAAWAFLTPVKPVVAEGKAILLPESGHELQLTFNKGLTVSVEKIDVSDDAGLMRNWGDGLYRLCLTGEFGNAAALTFTMTQLS